MKPLKGHEIAGMSLDQNVVFAIFFGCRGLVFGANRDEQRIATGWFFFALARIFLFPLSHFVGANVFLDVFGFGDLKLWMTEDIIRNVELGKIPLPETKMAPVRLRKFTVWRGRLL